MAQVASRSTRPPQYHPSYRAARRDDNFGDHASVGEGVSELRIHLGPGYRVYYTIREEKVVLLLCGGDKSSQDRDIERAKEMAAELK